MLILARLGLRALPETASSEAMLHPSIEARHRSGPRRENRVRAARDAGRFSDRCAGSLEQGLLLGSEVWYLCDRRIVHV